MDIPNYDQEIERQHEPAVVLADPPEDLFEQISYPRSECCGALMVNGGTQCQNCGSDGKIITDSCIRCGAKDETNSGTANMVDGSGGMCAVCTDDMKS